MKFAKVDAGKKKLEKDQNSGKTTDLTSNKTTTYNRQAGSSADRQNDLLYLQTIFGNKYLNQRLAEEDDKKITDLSDPIIDKNIKKDDVLNQYLPGHRNIENSEFPQKIMELKFKEGNFHLGYLPKEKKLTFLAEKDFAVHGYQKKVYANRPVQKKGSSQCFTSQNWDTGAVAFNTGLKKPSSRILKAAGNFMDKSKKTGTLQIVTPFLNSKDEQKEKLKMQEARKKINIQASQFNASISSDNILNLTKINLDKRIEQKNSILQKQDKKKRELISKTEKNVENFKKAEHLLAHDDFFSILLRKKRQMLGDFDNEPALGQENGQDQENRQEQEDEKK